MTTKYELDSGLVEFTPGPLPEWPISHIEQADEAISEAAKEMRLFYYRQLDFLRQIPYLALEANGRGGGWNDDYKDAYHRCLYPIHRDLASRRGTEMYIELRSGVLLGTSAALGSPKTQLEGVPESQREETWTRMSDREIYTILTNQTEASRFVPSKFVAHLQQKMQRPYRAGNVEEILNKKAQQWEQLDAMMQALPKTEVLARLREEGYSL